MFLLFAIQVWAKDDDGGGKFGSTEITEEPTLPQSLSSFAHVFLR